MGILGQRVDVPTGGIEGVKVCFETSIYLILEYSVVNEIYI